MKHIVCICLLSLVPLATFATDSPDQKSIQGGWTPVKAELGGKPMPEKILKTISLKLTNGSYEVSADGHADSGTYTVDTSTKPKGMTVIGTEGPNKGRTFPCIYELEHDSLRICYDLSGTKRPSEFKTSPGTKLYLVTYTRKKD
jgi:uncharacterized protein (TIGR03067 family)